MKVLKAAAAALRREAAVLDDLESRAERTVDGIIRSLPHHCVLRYQQYMDLRLANECGYVEHVVRDAGIKLGVEIGKRLRAEYKPTLKSDFPVPTAVYEAEVIVLSRSEFREMLERAAGARIA